MCRLVGLPVIRLAMISIKLNDHFRDVGCVEGKDLFHVSLENKVKEEAKTVDVTSPTIAS